MTTMEANVKAGQNPQELFDVVDERDQVIGRATRKEVHEKNLRHRAIYVFIFGADRRIYLQKRSMLKDYAPGAWAASCSGHLDAGEDYDTAAVRELKEELGLSCAETPERWLRYRACEETGWEFVWVYRMGSDGPFVLNEAEIESGEWFTHQQITEGVLNRPEEFAPSFRFVWMRLAMELQEGTPELHF